MVIITSRSRAQYGLDALLTTLGWAAFGYLLATGTLAMLDADAASPLPPRLIPTLVTMLEYLALTLAGALLLLVWAKYNQLRFRGKDRRKTTAQLSEAQLRASFGLSAEQMQTLKTARATVIDHDDDGHIIRIEVVIPLAPEH